MDFSVLFLLPFILLPFLYALYNKKSQLDTITKHPLPPGKTGWPFIGETLEYLSTSKNGVPEKFIEDRRKKYSTSVFKTSLLGEHMTMLCSAEGNKFLFSNENKLVQSWWLRSADKIFPKSGNRTTTEESKRLRKILPAFLKPDALQKYVGVMDEMAKQHIKTDWDCEQVKVHPLMRNYTFMLACRLLFDIEDPEQVAKLEKPFSQIGPGMVSIPVNFPGTAFYRAIRASKQLHKQFEHMIKQRKIDLSENKVSKTQDLLSLMLLDSDENGQFMNEREISNKIVSVLTAAHGTATRTLVSLIKYLAELPEIYRRVLTEQMEIANSKGPTELLNWEDLKKMKYSWNVVSEVLRLSPPIQGAFREAITDFTYGGYRIPKGWMLHWNAYATHKNPEYFPNPEKFDPSRYEGNGPIPYAYVPFGGGPRMCPGREYARLEILVFMHNLVTKFKWEKVFPDERLLIDPVPMPAKGLLIRLFPHKP